MPNRRRGRRAFNGIGVPADLDSWIASMSPTHWWKMDEASGAFVDSGSTGGLDMVVSGTNPGRNTGGPDASTDGADWVTSGNWGRDTGAPGGTSGTVILFWNNDTDALSGAEGFFGVDSANEVNMIVFGFGGKGFGTAAKPSMTIMDTSLFSNRVMEGGSTLASADSVWHSLAFVQDGSTNDIEIYYDGVLETITNFTTGGTPPGKDSWFATGVTPTRSFIANGRYASAESNLGRWLGPVAVIPTALTQADITQMHSYL
jgi:hypothetical protein